MLRAVLEGLLLFILPFAGFGLYLVVRGQNPLEPAVWSRKSLSWLTLTAIVLCILGLIYWGIAHPVGQGTWVPSHVDPSGRFVPGQFRP